MFDIPGGNSCCMKYKPFILGPSEKWSDGFWLSAVLGWTLPLLLRQRRCQWQRYEKKDNLLCYLFSLKFCKIPVWRIEFDELDFAGYTGSKYWPGWQFPSYDNVKLDALFWLLDIITHHHLFKKSERTLGDLKLLWNSTLRFPPHVKIKCGFYS